MSESITSTHFPNAFYRVSVKALIRKSNYVLFNWEEEEGYYALPGGGLDWGENINEGLAREIKEETGYEVLKIAKSPTYALPHIVHNRRNLDWFYNFIVCFEVEVDFTKKTLGAEYDKVEWKSLEEILTVPLFEGEESLREVFREELRKKKKSAQTKNAPAG